MPEITSKYRKAILTGSMREYIISKVKKPLMKVIVALAERYPEPTRENCTHPNTLRLMDIRDKFFEHDVNKVRKALFEAAFKLLIAEYEHDPYYRYRFDWFLEEINKGTWLPRSKFPPGYWDEPERMQIEANLTTSPKVLSEIRNAKEPLRNILIYDLFHPVGGERK